MLTFQDVYELLRKEKYSEQLQPLTNLFLKEFSEYTKEKKEIFSKESSMFSDTIAQTKKQYENALSIFKELMLRRRKKILNLAFIASETGVSKKDFENMLDSEKSLFEEVVKQLEEVHKKTMDSVNGVGEEKRMENMLVKFKTDVENFLDISGLELGPFNKGDIANISKQIAQILIKDNKAAAIDDDSSDEESE